MSRTVWTIYVAGRDCPYNLVEQCAKQEGYSPKVMGISTDKYDITVPVVESVEELPEDLLEAVSEFNSQGPLLPEGEYHEQLCVSTKHYGINAVECHASLDECEVVNVYTILYEAEGTDVSLYVNLVNKAE